MTHTDGGVRLSPWSAEDFELLLAANTPAMTAHIGGPETPEELRGRHRRYTALSEEPAAAGRMYRITLLPDAVPVGSIGFWPRTWDGETVYETGWSVLPGFQGRGAATAAATALIAEVRAARPADGPRFLHAYPSVGHAASNAVCRKAGFSLRGERRFEYPPGNPLRSNDWRLDLTATR
ncbi:GNAT family N-acetyltransferase [Streptomyces sp. MUM 203J]|uniref:GNAT family N-acetyltransferase n=1 Tax=Streptomyces sp. MUM 203J TaxID=2791990 RepID=UPI001F03D4E0|nr:GNAT family N-acetyltransferase [Streptomyces sp. MUM 203J]MCH0541387.1 GNAT family N-acetyltransferase [Streptomyces sp. MUM 203J]